MASLKEIHFCIGILIIRNQIEGLNHNVTQEISSGDLQWYDMTDCKSISTLSETRVKLNKDYCPKT